MLILQAQEEERRRLALELHDESSQNLSALLIHTEILHQSLQAIPDQITTQPIYQQLSEGLQVLTPHTKDIRQYTQFGTAVASKRTR